MSPQRRTALASVVAAAVLIGLKLAVGLAAGSLGLMADAAHSGTDLVAALLTFFAVGVATKPADAGHLYGHGKAEHLAALAEAGFLVLVSLVLGGLAVARLAGWITLDVEPAWWAFAALGIVLAIDLGRTVASHRAAQRYASAALSSNALHFGSDLPARSRCCAASSPRGRASRRVTRSRPSSSPCSSSSPPRGSSAATWTC